jgi:hypothetical protein
MRCYELRDPLGRKIGRLEELFAGEDVRATHIRVRVEPFGLGKSVLIPIEAVAVDGERRIVVLRR